MGNSFSSAIREKSEGEKEEEEERMKRQSRGLVMGSAGEFWELSKTFIIFDVDYQKT